MELYNGDCHEILPSIRPVDLVLVDVPYGTTRNKWDTELNLELMWSQLQKLDKGNTCLLFFAQTPFDKKLGFSNISKLRYEWIWEKPAATGHLNAKKMPMKAHENILVFYNRLPTYNPQKTTGHKPVNSYTKHQTDGNCYGQTKIGISGGGSTERYPRSVQIFSSDKQKSSIHETQKPVALLEYLIRTYTNQGDTVLDFCMGSGSTGVAAINCGRKFIGIEKDKEIFNRANARLKGDCL